MESEAQVSRKLHRWVAVMFVMASVDLATAAALYEVEVDVPDQSPSARQAAAREGLDTVLLRMSGLAALPASSAVLEAREQPQLYYNRFLFVEERRLKFFFAPAAVLDLIDRARLPIWPANRPTAIAWLVVGQGGRRRIVQEGHPLAVAMEAQARLRGVDVYLPLMDLQDQLQVQPSVVWGGAAVLLAAASRRYGAAVVLSARLQQKEDRSYEGRALASMSRADLEGALAGENPAEVGAAIADFLADGLASRYAIPWRAPQWLPLTVEGVVSPLHYGQLLRYLEALDFVRGVQFVALDQERLEVALQTRAEMASLIELLTMDDRMAQAPGALVNRLTWRGEDDSSRFVGRGASGGSV